MTASGRDARLSFSEAADLAVEHAMAADPHVIVFGEDVPMIRRRLLARFGPDRVRGTPISESAFLGAGVGAAMAGLRPIVEIMLVDFLAVGLSALQNEAAKLETFSGGRWRVPMVVRATCGGGYGDAGQHEQALWGLVAGIPGISVVVPSNPADAAGLMRAAIEAEGPVVYLEHKLLSAMWLEWMGGSRRAGVDFDVPSTGAAGPVADPPDLVPIGKAAVCREGSDLSIISLGVGVHRSLSAAERLRLDHDLDVTVIDLRTVSPLDTAAIRRAATLTGRVLVVDEDYIGYGLSGEVAAVIDEVGSDVRVSRVATEGTIPYSRRLEDHVLPSIERIVDRSLALCGEAGRTPNPS
jgi:pyruvate dehydrogenase E1 component beta subunit